jgi:hypothetical protein
MTINFFIIFIALHDHEKRHRRAFIVRCCGGFSCKDLRRKKSNSNKVDTISPMIIYSNPIIRQRPTLKSEFSAFTPLPIGITSYFSTAETFFFPVKTRTDRRSTVFIPFNLKTTKVSIV